MRGTCHCGAVELEVALGPEGLARVTRCDCSFCSRRQAANVSVPLDGLRIVRGEDRLTLYIWNTGTAKHFFCSVCGIYTHHRRRSDPDEYGVNVGILEGVSPKDFDPVPWTDGRNPPSDR